MAFRRINLPSDPNRGSDVGSTNYRIDENGKLVVPDLSDTHFGRSSNKNARHSETKVERYDEMCRHAIEKRCLAEGMTIGYVPGTPAVAPSHQPSDRPQAPVFCSSFAHIPEKCSRLVLLIGSQSYDPHIISRHAFNYKGISAGSIAGFAQKVHARRNMGLVVANMGQRIWSKTLLKAMTYRSWMALPRDKATDPQFALALDNYIDGSGDPATHLATLFRDLIMPIVRKNSNKPKVYIICYGSTDQTMQHMQENWDEYKETVEAIVVCNGTIDGKRDLPHPEFAKFWSARCKNYSLNSQRVDTHIESEDELPNCFSAGIADKGENILPAVYRKILDYFDYLHDNPTFQLPQFKFKLDRSSDIQNESDGAKDSWNDKPDGDNNPSVRLSYDYSKMLESVAKIAES